MEFAVGVSTFNGGGQVSRSTDIYYQDVRPISTSGIGTGVSFYITRGDSDYIEGIAVNRPGYGYTAGEVVTLSAEDIGGSINGASNMELTLVIDATISGGSGYALTFTQSAGGTSIQSRGYDKNGYQSIGTDRTYTFTEGDTISFHNDTSDEYSSYDYMGLTRYIDDKPTLALVSIANTEVVWSYGQTNPSGVTSSWTPSKLEKRELISLLDDIVRMKIILQLL